jgi:MraZ protein
MWEIWPHPSSAHVFTTRREVFVSTFLGKYLHAIDDKGRVPLPAKFRNGEVSPEFVVVRGPGACLYLFPQKGWQAVSHRVALLRQGGDLDHRRRALAITGNAAELVLDKQGRLTLPQGLMEVAGLEHEALFVGDGEQIQIWNPGRFEEFMKETDRDYDLIAASVL